MKLLIILSIILILFLYVWGESQALKLINEVNRLKIEYNRLLDQKRQSIALVELYSTLPRIEQKALELGMHPARDEEIIGLIER